VSDNPVFRVVVELEMDAEGGHVPEAVRSRLFDACFEVAGLAAAASKGTVRHGVRREDDDDE